MFFVKVSVKFLLFFVKFLENVVNLLFTNKKCDIIYLEVGTSTMDCIFSVGPFLSYSRA